MPTHRAFRDAFVKGQGRVIQWLHASPDPSVYRPDILWMARKDRRYDRYLQSSLSWLILEAASIAGCQKDVVAMAAAGLRRRQSGATAQYEAIGAYLYRADPPIGLGMLLDFARHHPTSDDPWSTMAHDLQTQDLLNAMESDAFRPDRWSRFAAGSYLRLLEDTHGEVFSPTAPYRHTPSVANFVERARTELDVQRPESRASPMNRDAVLAALFAYRRTPIPDVRAAAPLFSNDEISLLARAALDAPDDTLVRGFWSLFGIRPFPLVEEALTQLPQASDDKSWFLIRCLEGSDDPRIEAAAWDPSSQELGWASLRLLGDHLSLANLDRVLPLLAQTHSLDWNARHQGQQLARNAMDLCRGERRRALLEWTWDHGVCDECRYFALWRCRRSSIPGRILEEGQFDANKETREFCQERLRASVKPTTFRPSRLPTK